MKTLKIVGGNRLAGSVKAGSAKNAVLPIMAASILSKGEVLLTNCPRLTDVDNMMEILRTLGCRAQWVGNDVLIDASHADGFVMPEGLSKEIRSSIFMLGPILARHGQAAFTYPGGCEIGLRPIDLHLSGLKTLGATVSEDGGLIHCAGRLRGATVHLDYPSVGATENIMMAAVMASGTTIITNAAREPEVEDLAVFVNQMGGKIRGAGGDTIVIEGVDSFHGIEYQPMTDRIVAGTLLCAAVITRGDIYVPDANYKDMAAVVSKLRETGADIEYGQSGIRLRCDGLPKPIRAVETRPYPGFPTDMQAQVMAMLTTCDGASAVTENVFENRFGHVSELKRMGADIEVHDRVAIVRGVPRLKGARVCSRDLRGGAALVLAGLMAHGETIVDNVKYVDRGYDCIEGMLCSVGAQIERS